MLDELAKALWACDQGSVETPFEKLPRCARDNLYDSARAVLTALREPDEGMVRAANGMTDLVDATQPLDLDAAGVEIANAWKVMIDHILEEGDRP